MELQEIEMEEVLEELITKDMIREEIEIIEDIKEIKVRKNIESKIKIEDTIEDKEMIIVKEDKEMIEKVM